MGENGFSLRGTLALAKDFFEVSKSYERVNYAALLQSPQWWISKRVWLLKGYRTRRLTELRSRRTLLVGKLSERFEGILYELFTSGYSSTEFAGYIAQVWRKAQIAAVTVVDYRRFSVALWQIHLDLGSDVRALRPKFMLRQFVDEMPPGSECATLCLLAYGGIREVPHINKEFISYVKRAYPVLHREVMVHLDELSILTGDELSPVYVSTFEEPFPQYHQWLFRNNKDSI